MFRPKVGVRDGSVQRLWLVVSLVVLITIAGVGLASAKTTVQLATYAMGGLQAEDWWNMLWPFMEATPDIDVAVQIYSFGEYNEKLMVQIAAGVPPDLMQVWAQYKPKYVEMGILRDITAEWESSRVARSARLYPFVIDAPKSEGRMYGVPFDFNSMVWFVNLEYLSEKGVVFPGNDWTVEDLRALARKLVDPVKQVYATYNEVARGVRTPFSGRNCGRAMSGSAMIARPRLLILRRI